MNEDSGGRLVQLGGHRNGRPRAWAIVDAEDYDLVMQWRWSFINGYARRMVTRDDGTKRLYGMHRLLLGLAWGDGLEADHINRNRIDNRRANLRVVTHAQNCQNIPSRRNSTSRYRGVRWSRGNWSAYAHLDGEFVHLGCWDDEDEAGRAASTFRAQHMPFAVEELAA